MNIGLGAAVGLNISPFGVEELLGTLYCEVLGLVDNLTAAVVALCRISLGVFVGKAGAHGAHYFIANEVLTGDEFDSAALAEMFTVDDVEDLVVSFHFYCRC